jgi:hypothetical protein
MNANELADKLEYLYQQDDADGIQMPVFLHSATMLRTIPALQAEIEALKKENDHLKMVHNYKMAGFK